jgi:hypothetical protein
MPDADDYKKFAYDCLERAKRADSEPQRKSLLELALAWSRLAEEAGSLHCNSVPADKPTAFH